jgi:hypothetical protein
LERLVDRILAPKQRDAGADVSALEREIDELVYALYGLTPEEIELVEGRPNQPHPPGIAQQQGEKGSPEENKRSRMLHRLWVWQELHRSPKAYDARIPNCSRRSAFPR